MYREGKTIVFGDWAGGEWKAIGPEGRENIAISKVKGRGNHGQNDKKYIEVRITVIGLSLSL